MKLPELPELPGPQAAIDIPDHGTVQVGWTAAQMREFAREYAEAVREACAKVVEELDCAHRCGIGSEVAAAIRRKGRVMR